MVAKHGRTQLYVQVERVPDGDVGVCHAFTGEIGLGFAFWEQTFEQVETIWNCLFHVRGDGGGIGQKPRLVSERVE